MKFRRLLWLAGALLVALPAFGFAASPGQPAPALSLPDAAGRTVDLAALRGKVVYVDFWASWCGPCKRSFPWMNEMHERYGALGFEVVAVNVDKRREDAAKFLAAAPAKFTVVYDAAGKAPAAWDVKAMPTSFLVDATGNVLLVESGFRDERKADVEARIRDALVRK